MKKTLVPVALAAALLATAAQAQMGGYGGSSSSSQSAPPSASSSSSSSSSSSHASAGKISKDVGVALKAAQDALSKKDFATAMTQIKAAQAVSDRTDFDDFNINRFLAIVAANQQDYATAATAYDAAIGSPYFADLSQDEQKADYHNALLISENVQHFPQVIQYGQKLEALKGLDDLTMTMLAVAYYKTNDTANAQKYAQMAVDAAKAAGKQPQPNALIILNNVQGKKNPDAARKLLEQLVVSNNDPGDWAKLIDDALSHPGTKPIDALDLFRLRYMIGDGAMAAGDYTVMGPLAAQLHLDKEAAMVLEQGISSGKITSSQAGATLSKSRSEAAKDAGVLSTVAAAASRAKHGQDALALAEDYWGYGRFADVESMANLAISKGSLKDPGEAKLLLGMAQAAQGKGDEARTTLAQVSGSPARVRAAQLWALYTQAKTKQSAPASQPAAQPAGH